MKVLEGVLESAVRGMVDITKLGFLFLFPEEALRTPSSLPGSCRKSIELQRNPSILLSLTSRRRLTGYLEKCYGGPCGALELKSGRCV